MVAVASVAAHALNRKHHPRLGPLPAEEVDGRVFRKTDIVRSSLAELFLPFGALERASELTNSIICVALRRLHSRLAASKPLGVRHIEAVVLGFPFVESRTLMPDLPHSGLRARLALPQKYRDLFFREPPTLVRMR